MIGSAPVNRSVNNWHEAGASTNPFRSAAYLLRVVVAVGLAMVRRAPR